MKLCGLLGLLRKNPELLSKSDSRPVSLGIVELATELPMGEKLHYLPHQAIVRRDKVTTKVRVVYAWSGNSPSLNHYLYNGPPSLTSFLVLQSILKSLNDMIIPKGQDINN